MQCFQNWVMFWSRLGVSGSETVCAKGAPFIHLVTPKGGMHSSGPTPDRTSHVVFSTGDKAPPITYSIKLHIPITYSLKLPKTITYCLILPVPMKTPAIAGQLVRPLHRTAATHRELPKLGAQHVRALRQHSGVGLRALPVAAIRSPELPNCCRCQGEGGGLLSTAHSRPEVARSGTSARTCR